MPEQLRIIVVIRSVNERTAFACQQIVETELAAKNTIFTVKDIPFEDAQIESMRLAINNDAKWAVFLDGDILLRENAISLMLAEAETIASPFYMLNFRILDLGFAGPAYAGVHFYNVRYLEKALEFEALARQDERPETRLVYEMKEEKSLESKCSTVLVGLHGYEQYFRDLYRTSFVRGVKFRRRRDYILPVLRSRCCRGVSDDQDYQMMLWGWLDGSIYALEHAKAPLDAAFYQEMAGEVLSRLGIQEKGSFTPEPGKIEQIIREHVPDKLYKENEAWLCPAYFFAPPPPASSFGERLRHWPGKCLRFLIERLKHWVDG